jgi:signal transduction histidine kinase
VQFLIGQGQIQTADTYLGGDAPPEALTLQLVPFVQGMLYVGSTEALTENQIELVQALAEAFSVAYARYDDFKKLEEAKSTVETTLQELKATQAQLIQKEKMASLGELTAGIAHEIQNPLNFVNNFSEVNAELIVETQQDIEADNKAQALDAVHDIRENNQKIALHGKRADAIVKSMIEHSRSSTGQKEPTDLNALVDEYLRLAFHGMRAKNKDFNACIETAYDQQLGKVNVVPQDMGRVLLNLFNNAFYSVKEKKVQLNGAYEPIVSVSTTRANANIEISIWDNGLGIPQKIVNKIYQPFFTTKPTGQGTGLGLSLSYDIVVKEHGGELRVETQEGEWTEFIVELPE